MGSIAHCREAEYSAYPGALARDRPRGYLGLGFQLVAIEDGGRGAMVMTVEPQGPRAKAGVHRAR